MRTALSLWIPSGHTAISSAIILSKLSLGKLIGYGNILADLNKELQLRQRDSVFSKNKLHNRSSNHKWSVLNT